MSRTLRPTPARIALLRAISAGAVRRTTDNGRCYHRLTGREVTARVDALAEAGLIQLRPYSEARVFEDRQQWALTSDGVAMVDAAGSAS